ncbi:MAG TPA: glucose-6-phosphate dehydrogenase assembly protein OpcA [Gaiellaceae bacterium]|nr:glucose-6-phosphate dehydrogenase assembly protein OpcA [Gaiellaceae bacterium]
MATALDSVSEIERTLAALRVGDSGVRLRTNVMTHIAWVPEEWVEAAEDVLAGLAERHPSRTIVLFPQSGGEGLEGKVESDSFPMNEGLIVCTDTIRIQLHGKAAEHPASVVEPLLVSDLPVFLRWRGVPPFGDPAFGELIDVADRLIVDSTEWPGLPKPYARMAEIFDRVAVSDIAWARTSRWRPMLASLWPAIAEVERIKVTGTEAQAQLLAGWLRSRLGRPIALEHEPSNKLVGVELDGRPAAFPSGDPPLPADLLSDELDKLSRDPVYEAAALAAVT